MNSAKKFPPIFWVAFALLIVLNLSVFMDYQKPLDKYQRFAGVKHVVNIKAGGTFENIARHGEILPSCNVVNDGTLTWQSFKEGKATYVFAPLVAASPGKSNENAICQAGDLIDVDTTTETSANTVLVLLSIDFNKPL